LVAKIELRCSQEGLEPHRKSYLVTKLRWKRLGVVALPEILKLRLK
jgi:hypothetical protein